MIEKLQDRLRAKRFRPQEGDGIKLAYMRVFLQSIQVQASLLRDLELEDLKQRLEALEAMQAGSLAAIEDPVYNSNIENLDPRNISEF